MPTDEEIDELASLLKKHTYLSPSIDTPLALILFNQGKKEEALEVVERLISRTKPLADEKIVEFSSISLLVEQGKLDEALKASLALEEKLDGDTAFEEIRAYNLLRLLFITKDSSYLDKLKELPIYDEIEPLFHSGKINLDSRFSN